MGQRSQSQCGELFPKATLLFRSENKLDRRPHGFQLKTRHGLIDTPAIHSIKLKVYIHYIVISDSVKCCYRLKIIVHKLRFFPYANDNCSTMLVYQMF